MLQKNILKTPQQPFCTTINWAFLYTVILASSSAELFFCRCIKLITTKDSETFLATTRKSLEKIKITVGKTGT